VSFLPKVLNVLEKWKDGFTLKLWVLENYRQAQNSIKKLGGIYKEGLEQGNQKAKRNFYCYFLSV
jgi:hypothetical protein